MTERDPVQELILQELKTLRAEQAKGFSDIRIEVNGRIDRLASTEALEAERRRVDDRLSDLGRDITEEREARHASERAVRERGDKMATNLRWLAAAVVVPIALFLGNLVMLRGVS